jgi:hypothetical protein
MRKLIRSYLVSILFGSNKKDSLPTRDLYHKGLRIYCSYETWQSPFYFFVSTPGTHSYLVGSLCTKNQFKSNKEREMNFRKLELPVTSNR